MRVLAIAALAITLSACEAQNPHEEAHTGETPALLGEPAEQGEATIAAETPIVIPSEFHGAWDYVDGTCALESDLRMEISGSEIVFYESIGKAISIDEGAFQTRVDLAMEGEGEQWETTLVLQFAEDGETLMPFFQDGSVIGDVFPRQRCIE